jgi:hypothetical protein
MVRSLGTTPQILKNRYLWLALALLVLLMGLLIFTAPATNRLETGSTWNRGPSGYSAWFESLAEEGVRINRWQRPVPQLMDLLENGPEDIEGTTTTLIQYGASQAQDDAEIVSTMVVVLPEFFEEAELPSLVPWLPDWIDAGHRLVLLGVKSPATAAPFSQTIGSPFGGIEIDTRRRREVSPEPRQLLADDYGTVIWRGDWQFSTNESTQLQGDLIFVGTPFLAANAYLNAPGNFAMLTDLVTREGGQVWVDEYLHGYRDIEEVAAELGGENWLAYLASTPWLVFAVQAIAIILLLLLGLNRRLGNRLTVKEPTLDNSQAYINALAGVLHKANSHDFVVKTIAQSERLRLQKALGLGEKPVSDDQLVTAWVQQTGGSAADLTALLQPTLPRHDDQIKAWLKQLQFVHQFNQTRTRP